MARRRRSKPSPGAVFRVAGWTVRAIWWMATHPQPLVLVLVLGGLVFGSWRLVLASDAFLVNDIRVPREVTVEIPDVRGQNLWLVDLESLARAVHAKQPELKWVRTVRVPPSTVAIDARARQPIGQVQLLQWHPVDDEGFVFGTPSKEPAADLVMLKGVADPKAPLKPGQTNASERLQTAVQLARHVAVSNALGGHRLTALDVGDPRQLNFTLDGDLEIRCGTLEQLDAQLARLRDVLQRVAGQAFAIRYIDVRFPEPVIGPRT